MLSLISVHTEFCMFASSGAHFYSHNYIVFYWSFTVTMQHWRSDNSMCCNFKITKTTHWDWKTFGTFGQNKLYEVEKSQRKKKIPSTPGFKWSDVESGPKNSTTFSTVTHTCIVSWKTAVAWEAYKRSCMDFSSTMLHYSYNVKHFQFLCFICITHNPSRSDSYYINVWPS